MRPLTYTEIAEGPPGVDWDDFRVFLQIVRHGSFNRAAAQLEMTQPTVSRRLLRLEKAMGVRLFDRDRRGPRLTAEGQRIYTDASAAQAALMRAVNQTPGGRPGIEGDCTLQMGEGAASFWVSRFLAPFFTRHPNVGLKIIGVTGSANETREGSDLSIYYYQPPQADLVSLHIGTMHLLPFASREYVRVHGAPQNIEALSRHRLLDLAVYFTEAGLWATWSQQHAGTRALLLTNVAGCIAEAVHHGAGIAVLPSYALAVYDNLIPLDIGVHYTLPIYICYSRDAMDKWPVKATLEFLRECVFDRKNMPWFRERYIAPELDWHRRLESAVDQAGAEPASARAPATVPA